MAYEAVRELHAYQGSKLNGRLNNSINSDFNLLMYSDPQG